jgi:hypothetical protein
MFNCARAPAADRRPVYDQLAEAGVDWVRINVNWMDVQPDNSSSYSASELAAVDDCVQQARAHGIRVLINYFATPAWARTGSDWTSPPQSPSQYADAIRYMTARYRGQVAAWEIWNEENIPIFWSGTVPQYVAVLQAGYAAVKAADPAAIVVFGGVAFNDDAFLSAAYAAGAGGYFDVMATHPYQSADPTAPPEAPDAGIRWLSHVPAVYQVMAAHGDGAKPIWFTESGWSAPHDVSFGQQADYLTRMFNLVNGSYPYVTNVFWFQAINENPGAIAWEKDLALINPDLSPRPALNALKAWTHSS